MEYVKMADKHVGDCGKSGKPLRSGDLAAGSIGASGAVMPQFGRGLQRRFYPPRRMAA